MANEPQQSGAVLTGGQGGTRPRDPSIASQRPAAVALARGAAAGPWPEWAVPQLNAAVRLAHTATDRMSIATLLYRQWFNPVVGDQAALPAGTPLVGLYRAAHAGSRTRLRSGSMSVVARHDVIRAGGWWRTWGEHWTPPRSRPGSVRLLLTPRPDQLFPFVAAVTGRLLGVRMPWSLGCAIDPWRIARVGCAVLDLPALDAVPDGLLDELAPLLRPVAPPLCLPVVPGIGAADYPDNGMTFGEYRCHLIALALRHRHAGREPLPAIAAVFQAYGIDPAEPHRGR